MRTSTMSQRTRTRTFSARLPESRRTGTKNSSSSSVRARVRKDLRRWSTSRTASQNAHAMALEPGHLTADEGMPGSLATAIVPIGTSGNAVLVECDATDNNTGCFSSRTFPGPSRRTQRCLDQPGGSANVACSRNASRGSGSRSGEQWADYGHHTSRTHGHGVDGCGGSKQQPTESVWFRFGFASFCSQTIPFEEKSVRAIPFVTSSVPDRFLGKRVSRQTVPNPFRSEKPVRNAHPFLGF